MSANYGYDIIFDDDAMLTLFAQSPDIPLRDKAQALLETTFVRYGTTVASEGEWALLLAVVKGTLSLHGLKGITAIQNAA